MPFDVDLVEQRCHIGRLQVRQDAPLAPVDVQFQDHVVARLEARFEPARKIEKKETELTGYESAQRRRFLRAEAEDDEVREAG